MSEVTRDFVQQLFLDYYTQCFDQVGLKRGFEDREFAAFLMKGRIMIRHRSFKTDCEFQDFLCSTIPSDVYYSGAHYERPDFPEMNGKGWVGADLLFDIDADHIPTTCDKVHDEWTCMKCGFEGRGELPEKCPACAGEKFENNTWPCEICLTSAKTETSRLLDALSEDFGFSERDMRLFFSGHRGYHVHIETEAVKSLDAIARKEIVDYVCGLGFDPVLHGLDESTTKNLNLKDLAWRGRIARGIQNIVLNSQEHEYQRMGLTRNTAETLIKNKDLILKSLSEFRPWKTLKGVGPQAYRKLIEHSRKLQSARVDTVVTTDIHRLIRMPGTLHGKTGLRKAEFPFSSLDHFDPLKSAVAFKEGATCVSISETPEFRLGDEQFGPYKNERVELPTSAALLLVCKKRAEVIS